MEFNDRADYICNVELNLGKQVFHIDQNAMHDAKRWGHYILVFSEGGYRDGVAVGGWIAYATGGVGTKSLVAQGFKVPVPHDSFGAEAIAFETAVILMLDCLNLNIVFFRPTTQFSLV